MFVALLQRIVRRRRQRCLRGIEQENLGALGLGRIDRRARGRPRRRDGRNGRKIRDRHRGNRRRSRGRRGRGCSSSGRRLEPSRSRTSSRAPCRSCARSPAFLSSVRRPRAPPTRSSCASGGETPAADRWSPPPRDVAAEVAEEVCVLLEHRHGDASASEDVAAYSRDRAVADEATHRLLS